MIEHGGTIRHHSFAIGRGAPHHSVTYTHDMFRRELYCDLELLAECVLEQKDRTASAASSTASLRDLAEDDRPMQLELDAASFQMSDGAGAPTYSWLCGVPGNYPSQTIARRALLTVSKYGVK